jgi:hypothetical protein
MISFSAAAIALAYGVEAWARILAATDRVVVARLLGRLLVVIPKWVKEGANLNFAQSL